MKVTITRLRSFVNYKKPLETVLDSYFELLKYWMLTRNDIEFQFYNVSFDGTRPVRELKEADVWIIPSDAEYMYHDKVRSLDPRDIEKSNKKIEELKPYLNDKHIIILKSDRGDTEELYRTKTFEGISLKSFTTIDEIDFPRNVHGMKYHFLSSLRISLKIHLLEPTWDDVFRAKDFVYWGREKADERRAFMRKVFRDKDLTQILIGSFPSGVTKDYKWIRTWEKLYPKARDGRCTICFNWKDLVATTSRYIEALAIGVIPYVWGDYDINNTYNIADWQRVNSFEEFKEKCLTLREDHGKLLEEVRARYEEKLPSIEEYQELFNEKLDIALDK